MEITQNNNNRPCCKAGRKKNGSVFAVLLIIAGLIFLGRNLGIINPCLFKIIMSWQMLLIAIGLWSIIKKQYIGGLILVTVGAFLLIPKITGNSEGWIQTYWPIMLVLLGLVIIFKRNKKRNKARRGKKPHQDVSDSYVSENGFLNSDNSFGSARHIILDPVFKGATVKTMFAGTVIDLRRTTLEYEETFIDIDCVFGGIELHVPNSWCIISEVKPVFGGSDDKRNQLREEIDFEHKLIIRGRLNFSGIEIRS